MALEVTGEEDNIISDHLPNILNRVLYTALVANQTSGVQRTPCGKSRA
jgi:uncharacterized protein (DUF2249 family)